MNDVTIAILAGGASTRMGADKALVELEGMPMLAHVARAAAAAEMRCVAVGRKRDATISEVPIWLDDEVPGGGPLAALATALRHCASDVFLVACDMPLIDARSLRYLCAVEREPGANIIIARTTSGVEPLFAIYACTCLALADELLANGERSLMSLVRAARTQEIAAPNWLGGRLVSINTPEDLERVRSHPLTRLA